MKNNGTKFGWTLKYTMVCASYFAAFCAVHAYTSIFLLSKGFTNSQIGLTLAVANILSVAVQPIMAGLIDKGGRLTNRNVSMLCAGIMALLSVILLVTKSQKIIIFILFVLIYMLQMAYQPLIIAMNFEYEKKGCQINFGLARGLGSASFAVTSIGIGNVLEKTGTSILPFIYIIFLCAGILFLYFFSLPKEMLNGKGRDIRKQGDNGTKLSPNTGAHNNFFDFAKHYPKFMILLCASICFFFEHNLCNDYLIQIITPIGGTEKELGTAISLAAILELPTMMFFTKITKRINCGTLLKLSGVCFAIKGLLIFMADSMTLVYASQIIQMFAYALFIPASAYYVSAKMEEFDQVKGQAYINCAITIGGIFSSIICGILLDLFGTGIMMGTGIGVCVVGIVLGFLSIEKVNM